MDPALDAKVKTDLATAADAFQAMQAAPFDYAIQLDDGAPERQAILKAIQALKVVAEGHRPGRRQARGAVRGSSAFRSQALRRSR